MYIDFKCSYWERIKIPVELEKEVYKKITSGKANSTNDLFNEFVDIMSYDYELLYDTSEQLFPEDNNGCPTIEIYDEGDKAYNPVWTNGKY